LFSLLKRTAADFAPGGSRAFRARPLRLTS
jgi:hypothetical protein